MQGDEEAAHGPEPPTPPPPKKKKNSRGTRRRRRAAHQRRYLISSLLHSRTFMVGLGIVVFWIFMGLSPRFHAQPHAADAVAALQAPSAAHWFARTNSGARVGRTMAGARLVLVIAPLATRWRCSGRHHRARRRLLPRLTDEIMMRLIDVLLALRSSSRHPHPVAARQRRRHHDHHHRGPVHPGGQPHRSSAVIGERERDYVLAARLRGERRVS